MAPPKNTAQSTRTPWKPNTGEPGKDCALKRRLRAPLTGGPRVAAKFDVGLGAPEIVTVDADESGLGFCADELVMVNFDERE